MRHTIRELMTPVSDLAVVDENSTLFEAILAIGAVKRRISESGTRYPAVLVANGDSTITGFLEIRSMLKNLEPKYAEIAQAVADKGFSPEWIESEFKKHGLWANALDDICKKAGEILVKDLMSVPDFHQVASAGTSLNEAVFQMVVTGIDYLFVREGDRFAGIISLSEILIHVSDTVKGCRI